MSFVRRELLPQEWTAAVDLVAACGLPTSDLAPGRQTLWGAWDGARLVAVIGAEVYGTAALVRSMAVDPAFRGQGLASALFEDLEAWWQNRGHLILLTETAEGFFRRRGFELVGRDAVPPEVQASAEFQGLCPVSARVLVR